MTFDQWWKTNMEEHVIPMFGNEPAFNYQFIKQATKQAWDAALTNTVSTNNCNCNIHGYSESSGS